MLVIITLLVYCDDLAITVIIAMAFVEKKNWVLGLEKKNLKTGRLKTENHLYSSQTWWHTLRISVLDRKHETMELKFSLCHVANLRPSQLHRTLSQSKLSKTFTMSMCWISVCLILWLMWAIRLWALHVLDKHSSYIPCQTFIFILKDMWKWMVEINVIKITYILLEQYILMF